MTPEQVELVRGALRRMLNNAKGCTDPDCVVCKGAIERAELLQSSFDALLSEHAAMADRLRWRKQSEEPAPTDRHQIIAVKLGDGHLSTACTGCGVIWTEWRPL